MSDEKLSNEPESFGDEAVVVAVLSSDSFVRSFFGSSTLDEVGMSPETATVSTDPPDFVFEPHL
jgi:hypothetical protein